MAKFTFCGMSPVLRAIRDGVELRHHHSDHVAGAIQHRSAAVARLNRRGDLDETAVVAGARGRRAR